MVTTFKKKLVAGVLAFVVLLPALFGIGLQAQKVLPFHHSNSGHAVQVHQYMPNHWCPAPPVDC